MRSMKYYAGLDVAFKEISNYIVDETGFVCSAIKAPSQSEALARVLQDPTWRLVAIRLEAKPLSPWLFSGLVEACLPVVCIETRHTKSFVKEHVKETDRNHVRSIAQPKIWTPS
jgi:transposase